MSLEHGRAAQLATVTRQLYDLGWMRGTSGNVSVVSQDEPRRLLVSASGIAKHAAQVEHAVVTEADGTAVPGQAHAPSAEAKVHAAIVDVTGARSVVHVHAMSSVIAAARWPSGVVLSDVEQLKGWGCAAEGERYVVPVVMNSQDMDELSATIRRAVRPDVPAVIVAGHGLYVWGASLDEAAHRTESADWLLQHALLIDLMAHGR